MKLDHQAYRSLVEQLPDGFNMPQMRDSYIEQNGLAQQFDKTQLTLRVRYVLDVMLAEGLLEKRVKEGSNRVFYYRTSLFSSAKNIVNEASTEKTNNSIAQKPSSLEALSQQAKEYKVDLMACIGESEEYKRLFDCYPEMKAGLYNEYVQARDNSSKLLGKLKAVESAIRQYSAVLE